MKILTLGAAAAAVEPQVTAGAALARTAGSLLVVLLIIVALAWLARRLPVNRGAAAVIRAEHGLRLGARERVLIVNVEGRRLLLGVAPGQVSLLTELEPRDNDGEGFTSALDDALKQTKGSPE